MAQDQKIEGLPAGAVVKPIEGLPPGATMRPIGGEQETPPEDNRNAFQRGTDELIRYVGHPEDRGEGQPTTLNRIGEGMFGASAGSVAHPLQTIKSMGQAMDYSPSGVQHTVETDPGAARTIGGLIGSTGLFGGIGEGVGALRGVGSALRTAAIGDPDAAALRALNIDPKSPKALSMIRASQQTRPYVAGAQNLEDLQSRINPSKQEIWAPYKQAVGTIGQRPVQGPEGMTNVSELEAERKQTSALNRNLKSAMPNPESVKLAEQKGMKQADLLQHERDVKSALDPELASTGIKPQDIRSTYGGISKVGKAISGRSTLGEESQPYGLGHLRDIELTKPASWLEPFGRAGRDVAAGRPLFSGKPTDVAVRDAFRVGGPKPDLGRLTQPNLSAPMPARLPAPSIQLGAPARQAEAYRPPNFYHDTDAMRMGRLLPAPPIELGGAVEGPRIPHIATDTTPVRLNRLLPAPTQKIPMSSHSDIFPDQLPSGEAIRRIKK